MSYGVLWSRNGQLKVEPRRVARAGTGERTAVALGRFVERKGTSWNHGRLSLTALHLGYIPGPTAQGAPPLNLDLREIESVDVDGGRFGRIVAIALSTHSIFVKTGGAQVFADAVESAARDSHRIRRVNARDRS